jgi:hypothetical protein
MPDDINRVNTDFDRSLDRFIRLGIFDQSSHYAHHLRDATRLSNLGGETLEFLKLAMVDLEPINALKLAHNSLPLERSRDAQLRAERWAAAFGGHPLQRMVRYFVSLTPTHTAELPNPLDYKSS